MQWNVWWVLTIDRILSIETTPPFSQSQYLIILVIFCIAEAYQMTNFSSQPTKVAKNKNEDITLRCSLLDRHERFNRNASVTWWFKKNCKVPCWHQPDEDEWTEIDCGGACRLSFDLDDSTASNGFYLCKMFPYRIGDQTALQIEVTKTFEVTIIGKILGWFWVDGLMKKHTKFSTFSFL